METLDRSADDKRHSLAYGIWVTVAAALLLTACTSESAPSPAPAPAPPATMATVTRAICIDPTSSTAPAFSRTVRTLLASAVARWADGDEPSPSGAPGRPGLDLTVRTVSTKSFSSDETSLHVVIPPVPALSRRPDVLAPDFQTLNRAWQERLSAVKRARADAEAEAAEGAKAIARLPLDQETRSGITACAAALAVTSPAGTDRAFLIASDLDDNQPPQLAGSFAGAPLTLLQPCPSGSATRCTGLADAFSTRMDRLHSGKITLVRPELADSTIPAWLEGPR